MKSVIFDLDMTLVDSSVAEKARKERRWRDVYGLIPSFREYEGLEEVYGFIRDNGIKVAIVSTAPGTYVRRVVNHFRIPCNAIVAYHDVKALKPNPECMLKALAALGEKAENVVSFGDRLVDVQASVAAGIESVACLWGSRETDSLSGGKMWSCITGIGEMLGFLNR